MSSCRAVMGNLRPKTLWFLISLNTRLSTTRLVIKSRQADKQADN